MLVKGTLFLQQEDEQLDSLFGENESNYYDYFEKTQLSPTYLKSLRYFIDFLRFVEVSQNLLAKFSNCTIDESIAGVLSFSTES